MSRVIARSVESHRSWMHSASKVVAVAAALLTGTILPPSGSRVSAQAPTGGPEQPIHADSLAARDAVAKQFTKAVDGR